MKKRIKPASAVILFAMTMILLGSCKDKNFTKPTALSVTDTVEKEVPKKPLSKEFKEYWYSGNAEITSYSLEQARYGELREGKAVLIYVTEPFLKEKQVKAEQSDPSNIPVLKLNSTKKYLTGIYPYSIMSSSFYPVYDNQHAIKVTFSAQEWCGQVFAQLNNREKYNVKSFSYFEREGDKDITLEKEVLENELWNKIRIDPSSLPLGDFKLIPSLEYIRMSHTVLKPYEAQASLTLDNGINTYKIHYPELKRTLEIHFTSTFPYTIEGWSDSFKSGFGDKAKTMVSKATKIKTLKTPYWRQNGNKHLSLRDTLGL
ncbi:septum formation inhibitor Maf [Maribacter sp. ANRC-HE7]|uniref:Septum formation inhibitor Maf n=1 Tax=Maribacter aquimaris TaxID=2737171 RepID=A0ABR7UV08_9FLAO|nr:septum formation inhibitor Maf [Maribacter aquimaris]MBD0776189.1 septum formation inhibitor Maf [Maribacter aquimaris]